MTAGKVLIGGTAYEIKGGKTLIGGTAYDIKGGKTLIGGTGYDISFAPPREQTIQALMAKATIASTAGRNMSTASTVRLSYSSSGTTYLFSLRNGYCSVHKVMYNGSIATTLLASNSLTVGNIYVDSNYIYYSDDGTSATSVKDATLVALAFSDYTEAEIDNILSDATYNNQATRHSTTLGGKYYYRQKFADMPDISYIITAYNTYFAFSAYEKATTTPTVIISNRDNTNLSMTAHNSNYLYLTTGTDQTQTGTSYTGVYGGNLITVS